MESTEVYHYRSTFVQKRPESEPSSETYASIEEFLDSISKPEELEVKPDQLEVKPDQLEKEKAP